MSAELSYTDPLTGEVIDGLPGCDPTDAGALEAFYGNFGFAEHFRKVVLASCRESERAQAVQRQEKLSEARLDDLARTSNRYVDFLVEHLNGRRLREANVIASNAR